MKKILLWLGLLTCVACTKNVHLSVQTLYFSRETLASYYVETPDPMLINPPVGQKLLISWSLPRNYLNSSDLHLNIRIRFRNREEVEINVPIEKTWGSYTYVLPNECYFETQGIMTYKVTLVGDNLVLDEWRHQLWHELIHIGEREN